MTDPVPTRASDFMFAKIFTDYEIVKGKMDDVFLSVTGKKLLGGEK